MRRRPYRGSFLSALVAVKLLAPNIIVIDVDVIEGLSQARPSQVAQRGSKSASRLATNRLNSCSSIEPVSSPHRRLDLLMSVMVATRRKFSLLLLELLQLSQEGSVLRPAVGIDQEQALLQLVRAACRRMLMNGVMPMPPAMKTAGRARLLCRISDPNGPSSLPASRSAETSAHA